MLREVTCERILFCNAVEVRTPMFPAFVEAHRDHVPGTLDLEQGGQALQEAGFPDDDLQHFIHEVCAWGGYAGIAARVLADTDLDAIRGRFERAVQALAANAPDVGQALDTVKVINGLDVPFGSKHLRFLKPELCPVLDKSISGRFWHPLNADGYRCLSHDCLKIAEKLRECGIQNPMDGRDGEWSAADVEMALFAFAQDWHLED